MSTSKYFSAVCALVFVLALIVTVLFMNGERLGIRVIRDEDAEESEASQYFTSNDQNTDWAATATITLSGETATVSGPGAYVNGGSVTIASAGTSAAPLQTAALRLMPKRTPRCSSA